jgi:hypothetical protein
MTRTEYFSHNNVSNSDLSWLKDQLTPHSISYDLKDAYRMGTLIDAMITENKENIDYYQRICHGEKYTMDEFSLSYKMKNSFIRDPFCVNLLKSSSPQVAYLKNLKLDFKGIKFNFSAKCLYDLDSREEPFGCDIKSTTAKTQKEFESAFLHFGYHRQRAYYMDISGNKLDVVIGISKKNFKIFKVFIKDDSEIYLRGKSEYTYLAYKWYLLFGENKLILNK